MAKIGKDQAEDFLAKWQGVTASELSTSQSFLADLCDLLDVERPHPDESQAYMFERPVTMRHGDGSTSAGRIDLYRRGSFVLESKKLRQGEHTKGFDEALLRARTQAERYARNLPAKEGRPPFVIVVDVGTRIELYSEFSRSGATYVPFPDPRSHRIALERLRDPQVRERLRRIWTEPLSLDPSREAARVTREIAARLAELAKSLEQDGHHPEAVAQFLMRCLFTMFAEDVGLLPEASFRKLLKQYLEQPETAMRMLGALWQEMDHGGFSTVLAGEVLRFNGKLFKSPDTLPLASKQIELLIEAARAKWEHVEPAIFGTLLERALSPDERHKLGAHYTPRAYVERLVLPTIIEPLRAEWSDVQAAVGTLSNEARNDAAVEQLRRFHHRLCSVRVLDPACGSGNFLYVTLEHLKRLEGEVLNALDELGYQQTDLALGGERADAAAGETVDPHNLLGIELNPRAAAIAEVVLWIGYLQWHFRTRGDVKPPEPVVRDFKNIEHRDAVLAYDDIEYVCDERGVPVTRWDGQTMKTSPVTGEQVPDESAREPVERYIKPRKASWPEADFVVGNPPFIGNKRMRSILGDGYVEALRGAWPEVPESADYVMYWWHHAAVLTQHHVVQRFGFITTNSIRQTFNRRVVEVAMKSALTSVTEPKPYNPTRGFAVNLDFPERRRQHRGFAASLSIGPRKAQPISLVFAIPDHPWVDTADGAAVRIAMTVGAAGEHLALLQEVVNETASRRDTDVELRGNRGRMFANLKIGANVAAALALEANSAVSNRGVIPHGEGMTVDESQAEKLGLGKLVGLENRLRPYRNGRDLTQTSRNLRVIDMYGLDATQVREQFPAVYQWLLERVKPARDENKDRDLREKWWLHRRNNEDLRKSLSGLERYIATVQTSKHRFFTFLDVEVLPDDKLIAIALEDAMALGVLSSQPHVVWALAAGATLEDRPVYNKTTCFECFPFPAASDEQQARIRELGEQLDGHRKQQQAAHPGLTLTGMYNVLEKLRSGDALTAKERGIHEQGLVSVLRQIHGELDAAVLEAYGWADLLPLLRIAHGNEPSPPASISAGEGSKAFVQPAGDGGETEPSPPAPLPAGEGGKAAARYAGEGRQAEAKREFDEAILERLVALNGERAAEEARGHVRWLRPAFQNPQATPAPEQAEIGADHSLSPAGGGEGWGEGEKPVATAKKQAWPKDTVAQVHAVLAVLESSPIPLTAEEVTERFTAKGPWKKRLPPLLDMLVAVGRAEHGDAGYTRI